MRGVSVDRYFRRARKLIRVSVDFRSGDGSSYRAVERRVLDLRNSVTSRGYDNIMARDMEENPSDNRKRVNCSDVH